MNSKGSSGGLKKGEDGFDNPHTSQRQNEVVVCRFKRLGQEAKQDKFRPADHDRTTNDAESVQYDGLSSAGGKEVSQVLNSAPN